MFNRRHSAIACILFPMPKSANRTVITTFRTQPGVREALETAAQLENRSMSNLIERLAIEYCRHKGIPIAGLDAGAADGAPRAGAGES
jgi:hypothetical protein